MIVVTHLLGTGHLSRALTLARAFLDAGHSIRLVSGGRPVPHLDTSGIDIVQLPSLRSDGTNFTHLLDADDKNATPHYMHMREAAATDALNAFAPDALICELFPFGRRILTSEFMAIIDAADALPAPPRILSSIRDILAPPSKPEKAARTEAIVCSRFAAVLVHSDPAMTALDQSWPVSAKLATRLQYTGYVAPPPPRPHPDGTGTGEVLVTAGGGPVGDRLFRVALAAAAGDPARTWRLLVGGTDTRARIRALFPDAPANTVIEAVRPDFRHMLPLAAASVSLCGYNTALDLMQTGTPAVLVPFDDGDEVEQTLRAQSLARLPAIEILSDGEMTPERLRAAVQRVVSEGRRDPSGLRMQGAAETVRVTGRIMETSE